MEESVKIKNITPMPMCLNFRYKKHESSFEALSKYFGLAYASNETAKTDKQILAEGLAQKYENLD